MKSRSLRYLIGSVVWPALAAACAPGGEVERERELGVAGRPLEVTTDARPGPVIVEKRPDLGPYWQPLSGTHGGSYVYADSFVAPRAGVPTALGTWLMSATAEVELEIVADRGKGEGPDASVVLARTGRFSATGGIVELAYVEAPVLAGAHRLQPGRVYWFAASTVGAAKAGAFQVGGHTRNSAGIHDDGTFWWSEDPAGLVFSGKNRSPELAFKAAFAPRRAKNDRRPSVPWAGRNEEE